MKDRTNRLIAALIVALILIGAVAARGPLYAAPDLAPTAVANIHASAATGVAVAQSFFSGTSSITADTNGPIISLPSYSLLDIQYNIDQTVLASGANTTTLTLQYSNDGANWTNGPALATANVIDASVLNQYANFGRYTRVNADVSNTHPITITVLAVAKP